MERRCTSTTSTSSTGRSRRCGRACQRRSTSRTPSRRIPALAVVAHLGRLGLGADVASGGELATVARAGIAPDRVVMTGPGKRDDELRAAVTAGIRAVTVESPGELARLEAIAATAGRRQPVLLRAAVTEDARLERVRLVGDDGAGKFGMDAGRSRGLGASGGDVAAPRAAGPARIRRLERP